MNSVWFTRFLKAYASFNGQICDLDGLDVISPPTQDYGYDCTPANSLTFLSFGVDGVHAAILTDSGSVTDSSPIIQVSPMDGDDITVVASNFIEFLAVGCACSTSDMSKILDTTEGHEGHLCAYLGRVFRYDRLLTDESRLQDLARRFSKQVRRKETDSEMSEYPQPPSFRL